MSDAHLAAACQQVRDAQAKQPHPAVVQSFFDETSCTASHVIHDPETLRGAVIDSVLDFDVAAGRVATRSADAMITYLRKTGITVDWLLETHAHADHLSAALVPRLRHTARGG